MTDRRDLNPYHYDAKIRELLDGQARQTAETISIRATCEKIEQRFEALDARTDALETESGGNKKVARVAMWVAGIVGAGLLGTAGTYVTTTIRIEERQGAQERALDAVQTRYEQESGEMRKTLEGVREALVELRTESRATRDRIERLDRAISNQDRRRR